MDMDKISGIDLHHAVYLTLGGMIIFLVLLLVMHEGTHRHKRFTRDGKGARISIIV